MENERRRAHGAQETQQDPKQEGRGSRETLHYPRFGGAPLRCRSTSFCFSARDDGTWTLRPKRKGAGKSEIWA